MLKYKGQFRVVFEIDKRTGKPGEFSYIPCGIKKGSNICRHSESMHNVFILSIKIANRLLREHPELFKPFQMGDSEATLLFNEANIEKAAAILKVRVMGKDMSPRPKRKVIISVEHIKVLSDRLTKINACRVSGRECEEKGVNSVLSNRAI